jgi:hypothetical protein
MTEVRNSGITNYGGYQRIEGTTIGGDTRHDATDLTPEQHKSWSPRPYTTRRRINEPEKRHALTVLPTVMKEVHGDE